jgi:hypothetical protein
MSIGPATSPLDARSVNEALWAVTRDGHTLLAVAHVDGIVAGSELRYFFDDVLLDSTRYRGRTLARLRRDADSKLEELVKNGWTRVNHENPSV